MFSQFEPQTTSHRQVISDSLLEALHRPPPGHGIANVCQAVTSTLAYIVVVLGLGCRSSSPISSSEPPCRSRLVASECRSTWAPLCADSTPACFRARLTIVEIVDGFAKLVIGARWRRKTRRLAECGRSRRK